MQEERLESDVLIRKKSSWNKMEQIVCGNDGDEPSRLAPGILSLYGTSREVSS
jgi:hypothetical protein